MEYPNYCRIIEAADRQFLLRVINTTPGMMAPDGTPAPAQVLAVEAPAPSALAGVTQRHTLVLCFDATMPPNLLLPWLTADHMRHLLLLIEDGALGGHLLTDQERAKRTARFGDYIFKQFTLYYPHPPQQ